MMMGHPGKKLLFMGQDFAQENEWYYKESLDWHLCDDPGHRDVMNCYRALLKLYRERPVLHDDSGKNSFEWIDSGDVSRSIFTFIRRNPWNYNDALVFVINMTPVEYQGFGVGVPVSGVYNRVFSTYPDETPYSVEAEKTLCNGRDYKCSFTLRPFESMIFEVPYHESTEEEKNEEKKVRARVKRDYKLATNDVKHIPQVELPANVVANLEKAKTTKKAKTAKK
jgi:1,4-alpha-glucan branching enzyme